MDYHQYRVSQASKLPLLEFILGSLNLAGCRVLSASDAGHAPFRITFEDPAGQKQGIIVYAFLANSKETKNRPNDEHRFQVKYGKKDGLIHEIWQDPYKLYTTLMVGIDLERRIFVGVDPMIHQFTKFFISIEFKRSEVSGILDQGWHCWERTKRNDDDSPVETMVGGKPESFLNYVRFEQAAKGIDQGHRYLLAEKLDDYLHRAAKEAARIGNVLIRHNPTADQVRKDYGISLDEFYQVIQTTPRLNMPVRGWVAEVHLGNLLRITPGVDVCNAIEKDGQPDFEVVFRGGHPVLIECKNVLRKTLADGTIRVDFQKTRASKNDPCSRFYHPNDFQILAACLHPCTENWEFRFHLTKTLTLRTKDCLEHINNNVKIDDTWIEDPELILSQAG
jgi:hypothetical protein